MATGPITITIFTPRKPWLYLAAFLHLVGAQRAALWLIGKTIRVSAPS